MTATPRDNDTCAVTMTRDDAFPALPAEHTLPPEGVERRTPVSQHFSGDSGDRKPPGDSVPLPATLANGRYILGEQLGAGGVAKVVRAYDTHVKVDRAIKVIRTTEDDTLAASLRRRLSNEAYAMAAAQHPNVLPVHDVGEEGDYYYIVMDVAHNGSVMDRIHRTGAIPRAVALDWTIQVLAALSVAHDHDIVHRDVKPHNLMLDRYDRVLLGDFGIARVPHDRRTRSGVAMGSFAYMPPEQRINAKQVHPQADIYAVGATLYHMLTADNPVDLFLVDQAPPEWWWRVPVELRRIIRRACSVRPADRYQTAQDMAADLRRAQSMDVSETVFPVERTPPFPTAVARRISGPPPVSTSPLWPFFALGMTIVVAAASMLGVVLL